jgi:hypothetical protein
MSYSFPNLAELLAVVIPVVMLIYVILDLRRKR